jgi:hypothetical protein
MGDGDRAVVLAGDAGACRDVRLPGRLLEERVAWDSVWQCLHAFAKMCLASPGPPLTSHLGGDGPDPPPVGAIPITSEHALFGKGSASGKTTGADRL